MLMSCKTKKVPLHCAKPTEVARGNTHASLLGSRYFPMCSANHHFKTSQTVAISSNKHATLTVGNTINSQQFYVLCAGKNKHSYGSHGQFSSMIVPGFSPPLLMRMFVCSPCLRTPEVTQLSYRVGLEIPKRYPNYIYIFIHIYIFINIYISLSPYISWLNSH